MAFFHQFYIAMVESHKTLQTLIYDILFPCGDRVTSDEQEKLRPKKKTVSKNRCGRGARARSRLGIWYRGNGMIMLRKAICHVRYINILTWLRGFQDKLLSICCCFLCVQVSFGSSETKETFRSSNFDPKASEHVRILIIHRTWPISAKEKTLQKTHKILRNCMLLTYQDRNSPTPTR